MHLNASQEGWPRKYFFLVFLLSIPFWQLGGAKLPLPMNLPASALMWVNPAIATSILTYRKGGRDGVRRLLKKAFDYRAIHQKGWYLAIFGLVPLIYLLTYLSMRLAKLPLPDPIVVPVAMTPVYVLLFFIPAMGEELGWSGYAIDPLQNRWGALRASLIVGAVWQIWHVIPDVQAGHTATWILWHSLYSVALRVLIVWTYNNTGKSVFAATLVHAMDNVSWSLFPNDGSHLDPFVASVVAWLAALIIIFQWGPGTLARRRQASEHRLEA